MNVATFSVFMKFIKTFERTQLACTPWSTQLWTFFHLNYCSISSTPHWLPGNSYDLDLNDIIFCHTYKKGGFGIFESNWTCNVPLILKGFSNQFYGS